MVKRWWACGWVSGLLRPVDIDDGVGIVSCGDFCFRDQRGVDRVFWDFSFFFTRWN